MTPADAADLSALLKQLKSAYKDAEASTPAEDPYTDPVEHLVWSLLLWEATPVKAREAYKRCTEGVADLNELRVMLQGEFEEMLGPRYPLVSERAARIKMALDDVYNREHDVTLAHLHKAQKREARKYLESIDGLPHFVSARVMAVSLGGHAMPVDEKLRERLIEAGVADDKSDVASLSGSMERAIKAADGLEAIALFEAWTADPSPKVTGKKKAPARKKSPTKKKTAKKASTRKKTSKKSTRKTKG